MKKVEILVNGKAFPCRPTMGAMLRFKRETGRDITEMDAKSVTDTVTYLWRCVKAGCAREHVDFDLSLMDFADNIDMEQIKRWAEAASSGQIAEAEDEKKSESPS